MQYKGDLSLVLAAHMDIESQYDNHGSRHPSRDLKIWRNGVVM